MGFDQYRPFYYIGGSFWGIYGDSNGVIRLLRNLKYKTYDKRQAHLSLPFVLLFILCPASACTTGKNQLI